MESRMKPVPDRLVRALAPWIRQARSDRTGVEFARLAALANHVPEGCAVRVDFEVADELGAPLVILERPAAQPLREWPASLTAREREIAARLATGASNKQIARALGLSVGTVKTYVHGILTRLGLPNRASVAAQYRATA